MLILTISLVTDDITVNIDQIIVGDGDLGLPPDIWNLPPLTVADGPYPADWKGLSRLYTVPEWWREAKFGAWAHWDPQSMPEQGDWYARGMYIQGNRQYEYNLKNFGHPSEYGYKDICHNWVIDRWNPEELMDLFVEMGARYFMAMGVHHDNFDCWNSAYQPWNSVSVGPKDGHCRHVGKGRTSARSAVRHRFSQLSASNLGPVHDGTLHQRQDRAEEGRALRCAANDSGRKRKMVGRHGSGGPLRTGSRQQGSAAFALCQPVHVAGG